MRDLSASSPATIGPISSGGQYTATLEEVSSLQHGRSHMEHRRRVFPCRHPAPEEVVDADDSLESWPVPEQPPTASARNVVAWVYPYRVASLTRTGYDSHKGRDGRYGKVQSRVPED